MAKWKSWSGTPAPTPPEPVRTVTGKPRKIQPTEVQKRLLPAKKGRGRPHGPGAYIETREDALGRRIPIRVAPSKPQNDKGMRAFWEAIDKPTFIEALNSHPDNANKERQEREGESKWETLAIMLTAPEWNAGPKAGGLAAKARRCGISLPELVSYYSDYQKMHGTLAIANKLPEIHAQLAADALSKREFCPRCDGVGAVIDGYLDVDDGEGGTKKQAQTRTCPQCKGSKDVEVAADPKARELVFEVAGITNKGGKGVTVAIQQNFNSEVESTVMDVGKLLSD